ncbi:MAG: hypothetical protein BGO12_10540 [Verrucomicrobia bacterium 61-8]|nr:hypothetical protein [Verrucomicrobiota bacterium]OJV20941.1 MAG: hypothetical protein BGO12_10540 [Verrucomicrobia bacterium 61-8]
MTRIKIQVLGDLKAYGILFLPPSPGRYPLIIAQHGGLGSPELAAGLHPEGSANYNALIKGLLRYPVAVFAPQLLVWHHGQEPKFDQNELDRSLRQLGGSRAAVDLCMLRASLNWLLAHPEIDAARVGMTGLSYGGFYSLYFGALEPRIRVLASSCFVNDRYRINREDMVWTDVAREFLDAEIGGLFCPRPLFIEAGEQDTVFPAESFLGEARKIARIYDRLGKSGNFVFRTHSGGHEYDPDGAAERFLLRHLGVTHATDQCDSLEANDSRVG